MNLDRQAGAQVTAEYENLIWDEIYTAWEFVSVSALTVRTEQVGRGCPFRVSEQENCVFAFLYNHP